VSKMYRALYDLTAEWLRDEGYLCNQVYVIDEEISDATGSHFVHIYFEFTARGETSTSAVTYSGSLAEFLEELP
jgi:hypothetical protein